MGGCQVAIVLGPKGAQAPVPGAELMTLRTNKSPYRTSQMRKLVLAAAVAALTLTSCQSGPKRLSRNWDNWVNQKYTESSWIHGALLQDILPVYPIVGFVMAIGDTLLVNPYYFWSEDAWDGKGTGFNYAQSTDAQRSVGGFFDPRSDG